MRLWSIPLLLLVAPPVGASDSAPSPPSPPKPGEACGQGHFRDFDFWVGEWDVYGPQGKLAGRSRIERILGDCAIAEHWRGSGGTDGRSHNMYDATRGRWTQFWVDNGGNALLLHGGLKDGAMVLQSEDGSQRITWTPQADGRVRQHWESTKDGGQTWTTAFDGWYQKAGSEPPTPAS